MVYWIFFSHKISSNIPVKLFLGILLIDSHFSILRMHGDKNIFAMQVFRIIYQLLSISGIPI